MDAVKLYDGGVYLVDGALIVPEAEGDAVERMTGSKADPVAARMGTMAAHILCAHDTSQDDGSLRLRFDALTSPDNAFVNIIQTARASGLTEFPVPYTLTCCHNTLCAVGGTINEDDHRFGLSAAKRYGGIFVPPHLGVLHQVMRETQAGCGKMILGSDSHTRYGALGTLAIGEGGGELVKQLLGKTYDIPAPEVIAVYLEGKPAPYVGPQDIALAIIRAVFDCGYVKNKVMEFVGPGVASMTCDFRNGVDVMTTETAALSSIWVTDDSTRRFLAAHGREDEFTELKPASVAYYDGCVRVDLAQVRPMIALPFHPSNVYAIDELYDSLDEILASIEARADEIAGYAGSIDLRGKVDAAGLHVQQGSISGCAGGTYTNIMQAARALRGRSCGDGEFSLSVYPASMPIMSALVKQGAITDLIQAGAVVRTAMCGPCFGAGDTPANNALSIRHNTRNFPNREGSKAGQGQMAAAALMDARSIAATAANGGVLTSAAALDCWGDVPEYEYDSAPYAHRVYNGFGNPLPDEPLVYGPNIKDWPEMEPLGEHALVQVCTKILDPVTNTDEFVPSGEASCYRSDPFKLAEFTLSGRDPEYVGRAKTTRGYEESRLAGRLDEGCAAVFAVAKRITPDVRAVDIEIGGMLYATKPGDGSAREQAASCQRVLGGLVNVCRQYATKRYRTNLINWGLLPFRTDDELSFEVGDWLYIPGVRAAVEAGAGELEAHVIHGGEVAGTMTLLLDPMTDDERQIILDGCLINYNRKG
ncbi:hydratase [Collinsella tanakaei]|uniref:hydratase n=1 Tax=Collinsella tanakaei TaxID=626935 RepID=UPI0025A371EB|nr:hydratase [Collinsella tanakaei]MDM8300244.1 hydratase [Collinsella tanakaei]